MKNATKIFLCFGLITLCTAMFFVIPSCGDDDDSADGGTTDTDSDSDSDTEGDACKVSLRSDFDVEGTCQVKTGECEGGYGSAFPEGLQPVNEDCATDYDCCIDTDQCDALGQDPNFMEKMGFTAECKAAGGCPEATEMQLSVGCPAATPICCLVALPSDGGV